VLKAREGEKSVFGEHESDQFPDLNAGPNLSAVDISVNPIIAEAAGRVIDCCCLDEIKELK
jgi:hypothetical protein